MFGGQQPTFWDLEIFESLEYAVVHISQGIKMTSENEAWFVGHAKGNEMNGYCLGQEGEEKQVHEKVSWTFQSQTSRGNYRLTVLIHSLQQKLMQHQMMPFSVLIERWRATRCVWYALCFKLLSWNGPDLCKHQPSFAREEMCQTILRDIRK